MAVLPYLLCDLMTPKPGAYHSMPSTLTGMPKGPVLTLILLWKLIRKQFQVPAGVVMLS